MGIPALGGAGISSELHRPKVLLHKNGVHASAGASRQLNAPSTSTTTPRPRVVTFR